MCTYSLIWISKKYIGIYTWSKLILEIHITIISSKSFAGCPAVLRCDYGTENTSLGTAQIAFRMYHTDSLAGEKSFVYGPSKSNIVSDLGY